MINRHHRVLDAARVASKLWVGSHPPTPGHRCGDHPVEYAADVKECGFDVLVLCAEEYQPDGNLFPGVRVIHAPFGDDHEGLGQAQLEIALGAAQETAEQLQQGRRCLVTCWAGRNRSGLVTALALAAVSGMTPAQAGEQVRDTRGLAALTNMSFRGLLGRVEVSSGAPSAAKACELCEAKLVTKRHHSDAICWIADCKQCHVPMVVYRAHGVMPPVPHLRHMLGLLRMCGKPSRRGHRVDSERRTIPDHWHAHLRPA